MDSSIGKKSGQTLPGGVGYSFTTTGGVEGNLTLKGNISGLSAPTHESGRSSKSLQEVLRGQYLYQSGLLNEVILNILSHSSNRPIEERADSAMVNSLLHSELASNGITLPFEFAVVNRIGRGVSDSGLRCLIGKFGQSVCADTVSKRRKEPHELYPSVFSGQKGVYIPVHQVHASLVRVHSHIADSFSIYYHPGFPAEKAHRDEKRLHKQHDPRIQDTYLHHISGSTDA